MRGLTFACAALVFLAAPAHAAKVYKWVDGQGRVHYGSQPPLQAEPTEMDLRFIGPAGPPPAPAGQPAADAPEQAEAESAPAEAPETQAQSAEFLREQCDRGRQRLKVLREGGPAQRYRKADGTVFRFSGDDYAKEVARVEKLTQEYCAQVEG